MAEFQPMKVREAIQQMHPTKVLGPDGLSPIFYQQYWDVVRKDVANTALTTLK